MLEPNAQSRLRLVRDTTSDHLLRIELQQLLERSTMPFVPSLGLRNAIASCAVCECDGATPINRDSLCAQHRSRYNVELCNDRAVLQDGPVEHLDDLMRRAMSSDEL